MLKWVCFKVWIVHQLDCITNKQNEEICLTFISHIIISLMIKYKPVYEQMSDKKTEQNLILSTLNVFLTEYKECTKHST